MLKLWKSPLIFFVYIDSFIVLLLFSTLNNIIEIKYKSDNKTKCQQFTGTNIVTNKSCKGWGAIMSRILQGKTTEELIKV